MPAPVSPYIFSGSHEFGFELSQSDHIPLEQYQQFPQEIGNGTTTRSPFRTLVTAEPTSTTSPMNSCPRISPSRMVGTYPSYRCRSDPQMAVRVTLRMAS